MVGAGEQQEQRIATELEELPTTIGRDAEHAAEHAAEGLDQFLGADTSPRGETLGQRGEAGDVGEHHRALDDSPPSIRFVGHPIEDEARHQPVELTLHFGLFV